MMPRRKSETLHADKLCAVIEARGVASGGRGVGEGLGMRTWGRAKCCTKEKTEGQVYKALLCPPECGNRSLGLIYKMRFSIDSVSHKSVLLLESSSFVQKFIKLFIKSLLKLQI